MAGGVPVQVDDPDLAVVAPVVLLQQPLQRHLGGRPLVQVGEGQTLVGDVGLGLGGHGPDPGDRGGDGRADREELLEATATPQDCPSADRATIEKVMAQTLSTPAPGSSPWNDPINPLRARRSSLGSDSPSFEGVNPCAWEC